MKEPLDHDIDWEKRIQDILNIHVPLIPNREHPIQVIKEEILDIIFEIIELEHIRTQEEMITSEYMESICENI